MPSFSGTVALAMIDWLVEGQEKKASNDAVVLFFYMKFLGTHASELIRHLEGNYTNTE